ncbi:MAG: serine--tRNA ligase [Roseitalea sp.]|jgi:seryl-tRNA synthetase|nr:serine--tRNA ligase [Roseitalea sp.]MBO6723820.1 serine--tRNA ligase [Roseitalea sp.]MBO6744713.1 serine--tRNA ligase [Roseitalea sp.]
MLDIRWIRDNPDALDAALKKRGAAPESASLIKLDEERRAHVARVQEAQTRRNAASKEIGAAMGAGETEKADVLKAEVGELKAFLAAAEDVERELDAKLRDALARIPNVPLDDVPVGADEEANVELRQTGEKRQFNFEPKEHFELGEALGQMDFETAAKMSGARFTLLNGGLARLERALGQFMLDLHTQEHGYAEVSPPLLVRDDAMFGTGQLPKFEEDLYGLEGEHTTVLDDVTKAVAGVKVAKEIEGFMRPFIESTIDTLGKLKFLGGDAEAEELAKNRDRVQSALREKSDFFREYAEEMEKPLSSLQSMKDRDVQQMWLIPTAEVPLTNIVRETIIDHDYLPRRYTALTPCFRSEAGSAGRDTRGYLRQHQFYKVEMVSVTDAESSLDELERMTKCAETVLERLGLHFRTMVLSTGDMGFGARKTHDIEVWLPGQGAYREISSCSVCGDFQARRMNARYRVEGEKQTRFVHTLNGSGVAMGRALIAVMETYQQADGSIAVPDALKPYMGGIETITA